MGGATRGIIKTHGQRNTLTLQIDIDHLHLDHLPRFDHLVRIFDKFIGQRGHVHEPVLMHTDIDEGAERRYIRHDSLQYHAGLQITQGLDPLAEGRCLEFRARIAARARLANSAARGPNTAGVEYE